MCVYALHVVVVAGAVCYVVVHQLLAQLIACAMNPTVDASSSPFSSSSSPASSDELLRTRPTDELLRLVLPFVAAPEAALMERRAAGVCGPDTVAVDANCASRPLM